MDRKIGGGGRLTWWSHWDSLGLTWTHLDSLGLTRTHLDSLALTWTHLDSLGVTWTHLDSLGFTWTHLDSLGFNWTHSDSLGLTWTHWDSLDLTGITEGKGKGCPREKGKGKLTGSRFRCISTWHRLRAHDTRHETISPLRGGLPKGELTPPNLR